jgi:DNA-binding response OmpR family regulator
MYKTEILVIGQHEEVRQTAVTLINNQEQWQGTAASTTEDAIEKFHRFHFDVVVLINDIEEEDGRKLCKIFMHQHQDLILLQQDAETAGSELLMNGISEALEKHKVAKKPSYLVIDDALKGAELDVQIQ